MALVALLVALALPLPPVSGDAGADTLAALWEQAEGFEAFLPDAAGRNALWQTNWDRSAGVLDREVVARVRAGVRSESGPWRLLVVADAGCSDSMSTIPFLARLAAEVEGLELRIIGSDRGRFLMEAHPTPDGRGATPTVLLLDGAWGVAGCWVEQPGELQGWWLGEARGLGGRERMQRKMAWYEADAGRETVRDILELLDAAREGARICPEAISSPG